MHRAIKNSHHHALTHKWLTHYCSIPSRCEKRPSKFSQENFEWNARRVRALLNILERKSIKASRDLFIISRRVAAVQDVMNWGYNVRRLFCDKLYLLSEYQTFFMIPPGIQLYVWKIKRFKCRRGHPQSHIHTTRKKDTRRESIRCGVKKHTTRWCCGRRCIYLRWNSTHAYRLIFWNLNGPSWPICISHTSDNLRKFTVFIFFGMYMNFIFMFLKKIWLCLLGFT